MKARKVKGLDPDGTLAENAERIVAVRLEELRSFSPARARPRRRWRRCTTCASRPSACATCSSSPGPRSARGRRRAPAPPKKLQDLLGRHPRLRRDAPARARARGGRAWRPTWRRGARRCTAKFRRQWRRLEPAASARTSWTGSAGSSPEPAGPRAEQHLELASVHGRQARLLHAAPARPSCGAAPARSPARGPPAARGRPGPRPPRGGRTGPPARRSSSVHLHAQRLARQPRGLDGAHLRAAHARVEPRLRGASSAAPDRPGLLLPLGGEARARRPASRPRPPHVATSRSRSCSNIEQ